MEEWLCLLVLASSTSFLGSLFRLIVNISIQSQEPKVVHCLVGIGIGICLMAVHWLTEKGEHRFNYETLAAVCFLGGIFVHESWNFVSIPPASLQGN
jgi:NADH:ubiquinone oxidoreductase subunit 2 (subunit N)